MNQPNEVNETNPAAVINEHPSLPGERERDDEHPASGLRRHAKAVALFAVFAVALIGGVGYLLFAGGPPKEKISVKAPAEQSPAGKPDARNQTAQEDINKMAGPPADPNLPPGGSPLAGSSSPEAAAGSTTRPDSSPGASAAGGQSAASVSLGVYDRGAGAGNGQRDPGAHRADGEQLW